MSDREVQRLSNDLRTGNTTDAANVVMFELQSNPRAAMQIIRQANSEAGRNGMHIGTRQDGDMAIIDQYNRPIAHLGNVNQIGNPNNRGYNPVQGQGSDNRGYNPGQGQGYDNRGYNPAQGQGYDNRYNNQGRGQGYDPTQQMVGRLAQDLVQGNTGDALNVLNSLMQRPGDAARRIQDANQLADQEARQQGLNGAREHIGTRRSDGDVAIVDDSGRPIARAGNIYDANNGYDGRYNGQAQQLNYPQQGFPQQGFPQDSGPVNYAPSPTYLSGNDYFGDGSQAPINYPSPSYNNSGYYNNGGGLSIGLVFGNSHGGGGFHGGRHGR